MNTMTAKPMTASTPALAPLPSGRIPRFAETATDAVLEARSRADLQRDRRELLDDLEAIEVQLSDVNPSSPGGRVRPPEETLAWRRRAADAARFKRSALRRVEDALSAHDRRDGVTVAPSATPLLPLARSILLELEAESIPGEEWSRLRVLLGHLGQLVGQPWPSRPADRLATA